MYWRATAAHLRAAQGTVGGVAAPTVARAGEVYFSAPVGGLQALLSPRDLRHLVGHSPIFHWGGGTIVASDWSISAGSPTVEVVTRNGRPALKIVTQTGSLADVDLILGDVCWFGRTYLQVEGNQASGVNQIVQLVTPDTFTNYALATYTCQTAPLNNPTEGGPLYTIRMDGQVTSGATAIQFTGAGTSWGTSTPALDGSVTVNRVRVRVLPLSGQRATIYIYGLSMAPRRLRGRVAVTIDDGYKAAINLIQPLAAARGIPLTLSAIGNLLGNRTSPAGYCSWADARSIVESGGQVVAHGPIASPTQSLISAFSTTTDRIGDMERSRDLILQNGCATPNFDKAYVWPQGAFQVATGDLALLEATSAAGFQVARTASSAASLFDYAALSRYQKLALPIIGHTYAGAGEAANISAVAASIAGAGTARADAILMFHKAVKTADTPDALGIRVSDLITLLDAIVTEVNAGRLSAVVLGDFVNSGDWGF